MLVELGLHSTVPSCRFCSVLSGSDKQAGFESIDRVYPKCTAGGDTGIFIRSRLSFSALRHGRRDARRDRQAGELLPHDGNTGQKGMAEKVYQTQEEAGGGCTSSEMASFVILYLISCFFPMTPRPEQGKSARTTSAFSTRLSSNTQASCTCTSTFVSPVLSILSLRRAALYSDTSLEITFPAFPRCFCICRPGGFCFGREWKEGSPCYAVYLAHSLAVI